MTTQLVFARNGQALTTSEIIAQGVGVQHKNILALVRNYQADFETFNPVAFETRQGKALPQGGFGQGVTIAILSEQQATLLVTYCKNTETVRKFKVALVKAFYEMRLQMSTRTSVPARSPVGQAIAPAIAVAPITDAQFAELTAAVRAKASGRERTAAYSRLRASFRVVSLRQIPEARFQEALEWVRQYRVPVKALPASEPTPGHPVLTHDVGESRGLKMMSGVKALVGIGDNGLPYAQIIKNKVLVCPTSSEQVCAMLELVPDAVIPDILRMCTNRIAGMRRLTN